MAGSSVGSGSKGRSSRSSKKGAPGAKHASTGSSRAHAVAATGIAIDQSSSSSNGSKSSKLPTKSFPTTPGRSVPLRSGRTGGGSSRPAPVSETPRPAIEARLEIVRVHSPVHPGAILREEFIEPLGITAYAIAKACKMNRSKLERIVREELGISGDTAVRLGRYFGTSDQFWMNLQATYEVLKARQEIGSVATEIQPLWAAE